MGGVASPRLSLLTGRAPYPELIGFIENPMGHVLEVRGELWETEEVGLIKADCIYVCY